MSRPTNAVVRGLRTAYWVGAIVDAAAGVQMLSPRLFATMMGLGDFRPGPDFSYAMGMGAALMFGWTALLLWADRAPIERRDVLVLTVVPVVAGLVLNEIAAVRSGFLSLLAVAPIWVLQLALAILFLNAWRSANRAASAG